MSRRALHDLRGWRRGRRPALDPDDYAQSQALGAQAARDRAPTASSIRACADAGGECVGLFYPDGASNPVQGRHLDYHWNGERVDLYRDRSAGEVYRIV